MRTILLSAGLTACIVAAIGAPIIAFVGLPAPPTLARPLAPAARPVPESAAATVPAISAALSVRGSGFELARAAMRQVGRTVVYDDSYHHLRYPDGDVPFGRGACSDVVVRALRACGIDLQVLVHEDMSQHFSAYPHKRGKHPDPNIDHRRVRNLRVFFTREGKRVEITHRGADYHPGDIVTWRVGKGAHTGVVTTVRTRGGRYLIAHNFGHGVKLQDVLFRWPITGHYRWWPNLR